MKKVIYISGPIGDHDLTTDEGRKAMDAKREAFAEYEKKVRALGHEVINPITLYDDMCVAWAVTNDAPIPTRHAIMRKDLAQLLVGASEVWLMPGWMISEGCTVEVTVALAVGIPVKEIETQKEITEVSYNFFWTPRVASHTIRAQKHKEDNP